jgi:hypothetical protein
MDSWKQTPEEKRLYDEYCGSFKTLSKEEFQLAKQHGDALMYSASDGRFDGIYNKEQRRRGI